MSDQFIERRIVIGLITSTEFIDQIRDLYNPKLFESSMAKRLSSWCIEYYDKYNKAPGKYIEDIYFQKLKKGLPKDIAEEIQEDILSDLSEEFVESDGIDLKPLIDAAKLHFVAKNISNLGSKIQELIDVGDVEGAQSLIKKFKDIDPIEDNSISFNDANTLQEVEKAFEETQKPLLTFSKALGEFWNDQFVPGGFIGLLAPEKRGKTFLLLFIARMAVRQGLRVAFFQAGDMSKSAQIRRFGINLTGKSDLKKYCGEMYEPRVDCIFNQLDTCNRPERECDFGVFSQYTEKDLRESITIDDLKEALKENPDYKNCYNCTEFQTNHWGCPWIEKVVVDEPLTKKEAKEAFEKYYMKKYKGQLRLATYPNGTLTMNKITKDLNLWEKKYDFIPQIILIDYAELLDTEVKMEERPRQNEIWKGARRLSQEERGGTFPLVIMPTQADAKSYKAFLLELENFSEDKRKYGHVTAFYGINQDPKGREKRIGLIRLNELVLREGDFDSEKAVTILQNLRRGQPYIGSYF